MILLACINLRQINDNRGSLVPVDFREYLKKDISRIFLVNGNIINSVNFPDLVETRKSRFRITLSNNNIAGMIGQITTILADNNLNILNMVNKSKGDVAYNVIDTDVEPSKSVEEGLSNLEGVINVRIIKND